MTDLTEYDIETRQPEEMCVCDLNRTVRALRERLYQTRLRAQAIEHVRDGSRTSPTAAGPGPQPPRAPQQPNSMIEPTVGPPPPAPPDPPVEDPRWAARVEVLAPVRCDLDERAVCRRCGVASPTISAPLPDGTPTYPPLCCQFFVVPFATRADEALRGLRPEVLAFARRMEEQLRANDHKPGWKQDGPEALFQRLMEESEELVRVLHARTCYAERDAIEGVDPSRGWRGAPDLSGDIAREAADVANFAMMIADVCGGLPTDTPAGMVACTCCGAPHDHAEWMCDDCRRGVPAPTTDTDTEARRLRDEVDEATRGMEGAADVTIRSTDAEARRLRDEHRAGSHAGDPDNCPDCGTEGTAGGTRAEEALRKINDIRNSIIGLQALNWSEHVYPLVAALNEAGMQGMPFPEARACFGTMLERTVRAERLLAFAVRELGGTVRVPATALEHVDPGELEVESEGETTWLEYPARTRPRRTGGQTG